MRCRARLLICKFYDLSQKIPRRGYVVRTLGTLVSERDPSVQIARQLTPLPEETEELRAERIQATRRQEWYLRKCYARELRIIEGRSPSLETMEGVCSRVDTPGSYVDEPVSTASEERAPSRVRVHFFESGANKCPSAMMDTSNGDVVNITTTSQQGNSYFRETQQVFTTSTPNGQQTSVKTVTYTARQSTDSGIDNPFRPEGELSMEADEIVKAIKEGRPFDSIDSGRVSRQANGSVSAKNGSAKSPSGKKEAKPGVVDVQRGIVVPPSDAQQVEQVVLKKKPKCKCCVIQ